MDKSEEYIKMCQQANEIREGWRAKTGDYFSETVDGKSVGVHIHPTGDALFVCDVWLPKQDQLQDMLKLPLVSERKECLLDAIIGYTFDHKYEEWKDTIMTLVYDDDESHYEPIFNSMEQLWLAIVMVGKYNKVWNGEDWVSA